MASQSVSHVIQIVGRDRDNDRVFNTEELERLIHTCCNGSKEHYIVISIIGVQSSGKSTLLNALFNTKFQTLNQETGRKATTKGICVAVCSDPRVILLDIEGTDGQKMQDDAGFANQSALFGLLISDVVFFNINQQNIGLTQGASIPLLHTVLQERLLCDTKHKTKLVFAVRDYNKKTPESVLRGDLVLTLDTIWGKLNKDKLINKDKLTTNEIPSISQYFELYFEFFPNLDYKLEEFQDKCKEITTARPALLEQGHHNWPVVQFGHLAEKLWKEILKNERLDVPSYWATISLERCEKIMSAKFFSLQSDKDYESLTNIDKPSSFDVKFKEIMDKTLYEYGDETQYYGREAANKTKMTLERKIIHDAEPKFRIVMNKFVTALYVQATQELKSAYDSNRITNVHIQSVVSHYIDKFIDETKGLQFFINVNKEDQKNFATTMKFIGGSVAKDAKIKNERDIAIYISLAIGCSIVGAASLTGVGVAFMFGTLSPELASALTEFATCSFDAATMAFKLASNAAFQRSVDEILDELPKILDELPKESECTDSDASSSSTTYGSSDSD